MIGKLRGQQTGKAVTSQLPSPAGNVALVTFIPWTLVKRTVHKEIITPIATPQAFVKEREKELQEEKLKAAALATTPLLRALGLAFYWQQLLEKNQFKSLSEIAQAEQMDLGRVSRLAKLAYLAPEIVERIVNSQLTVGLSELLKMKWARDWGIQFKLLQPQEQRR